MPRATHIGWLLSTLLLSTVLGCSSPTDDPSGGDGAEIPVVRASPRPPEEKLSAALRGALESGSDRPLSVLVDLAEQVDLKRLAQRLDRDQRSKAERRERVVAALRQVAAAGRERLDRHLTRLTRRGWIERVHGYTVVNRLLVVGLPRGIRALAEHEEVVAIREETPEPLPALADGRGAPQAGELSPSWALKAVRADVAWRQGLSGEGVVIGIIDAGASAEHEQLKGRFKGGPGSWYDPESGHPVPRDGRRGHGTGLLSAALGESVEGPAVGVAPGATWVGCVGVPDGRYHNIRMMECADWVLTQGRPDILINAWVLPEAGCDPDLRRVIDAWRAAEILSVFAAGNYGPDAGTDRSPANYAGLYPGLSSALSVGGLASADSLYAASGRGPNSCDGSIYPSLVAPAARVTVAFPLTESMYVETEGTSVAAALVAGAAAILLQRYPEAGVPELEEALRAGAADLGPPGPDNGFGYGRLDIPGALSALGRLRGTKESTSNREEAPAQP